MGSLMTERLHFSLFTFMLWRRKWQPTPLFLPGESQGRGELGGLLSMGPHRFGHDWRDLAAAAAAVDGLGGWPGICFYLLSTHWVSSQWGGCYDVDLLCFVVFLLRVLNFCSSTIKCGLVQFLWSFVTQPYWAKPWGTNLAMLLGHGFSAASPNAPDV